MEGAAAWEEIARTVAMTCRNLAGAAAPTSQIERDAKFPIKWFQRRVPPNFASDPLGFALPVAPACLSPSLFLSYLPCALTFGYVFLSGGREPEELLSLPSIEEHRFPRDLFS